METLLDWLFLASGVAIAATMLVLFIFFVRALRWELGERRRTGWGEWRQQWKAMTRRDRRKVFAANSRGRAVTDPRLAQFAAGRAAGMLAQFEASARRGTQHYLRWLYLPLGLMFCLQAVFWLREPGMRWYAAVWFFLVAAFLVLFALFPRLQARTKRRLRASIDANRRLAGHVEETT